MDSLLCMLYNKWDINKSIIFNFYVKIIVPQWGTFLSAKICKNALF